MKTEVMFHCGNAPKMERVIDLTVALAGKDSAGAKNISERILYGKRSVKAK